MNLQLALRLAIARRTHASSPFQPSEIDNENDWRGTHDFSCHCQYNKSTSVSSIVLVLVLVLVIELLPLLG
jgi:hypothetical protein